MNQTLNDLRLLKLAEMYERAFETFVLEMATGTVHDPETRRRLMALVDPADQHPERIAREIRRLQAGVTPADRAGLERAAILDIVHVEGAARDFYLAHEDQVHDPQVAALFRALASEEARHARIAKETLAACDRRAGRMADNSVGAGSRLWREGEMDLFEGVGDLRSDLYSGGPPRRRARS